MMPDGSVKALTVQSSQSCCCKENDSAVEKNRNFVARRWVRNNVGMSQDQIDSGHDMDDFDHFIKPKWATPTTQ